jgi:hypothetical protein
MIIGFDSFTSIGQDLIYVLVAFDFSHVFYENGSHPTLVDIARVTLRPKEPQVVLEIRSK